ncbi:hypothetical protein C8J57DRAFT_1257694 [Mycena rebaudengoi]|nr:hypothetical protein C8J57DRAFT_1257694 [Mycena rebaudengoi]
MPAKRIDGLLALTARQFFCDPGYGICGNGMDGVLWMLQWFMLYIDRYMLPLCAGHGGKFLSRSYCDGNGCCPTGKVCSGGGGTITFGGGGGGGGGPPPTTTTHKRPPTTNHTAPPPPPPPPPLTTTHKVTTEPIDSSSDKASKNPTPTPAPSGLSTPPSSGPGNQNVWISVDDTKISWIGEWVSVGSTCNATSNAKRCSGESSLDASGGMLYTFSGYSISMSFASSNLVYSVQINEKTWSFSGSTGLEASNCAYDVVYQVEASTAQLILVKIDIGLNAKRSIRAPGSHGLELEERADITDASPTSSGAPRSRSRPGTFIVSAGLTVVLGLIFSLL